MGTNRSDAPYPRTPLSQVPDPAGVLLLWLTPANVVTATRGSDGPSPLAGLKSTAPGHPIETILSAEDNTEVIEAIDQARLQDDPVRLDVRVGNGTQRRLCSATALGIDGRDDSADVLLTLEDVTESRQAARELDDRLRFQDALLRVAGVFLQEPELDQGLQTGLEELRRAAGSDRAFMYHLETESSPPEMVLRASCRGQKQEDLTDDPVVTRIPLTSDLAGLLHLLREGKPFHGTADDLPDLLGERLRCAGVQSVLVLPVTVRGCLYGALGFAEAEPGQGWSESRIDLLSLSAHAIALALDSWFAREEQRSTERQLALQQAMAIRADRFRALGEMASGMAHEFNQPLSGIRGFAENLLIAKRRGWTVSEDEEQDKLNKIVGQTERMAGLLEHIRSFSDPEQRGRQAPVRIESVVESALQMTSAQLRARGIQLLQEREAGETRVRANRFALEEALLVLLQNARDALSSNTAGKPKRLVIATRTETSPAGHPQVLVEIRDSGPGIPAGLRERVFEPFYTTKPPDQASGLGLSTAQHILGELDGDVRLCEAAEGGACACISLPADVPEAGGP